MLCLNIKKDSPLVLDIEGVHRVVIHFIKSGSNYYQVAIKAPPEVIIHRNFPIPQEPSRRRPM